MSELRKKMHKDGFTEILCDKCHKLMGFTNHKFLNVHNFCITCSKGEIKIHLVICDFCKIIIKGDSNNHVWSKHPGYNTCEAISIIDNWPQYRKFLQSKKVFK